MITDYRIIELEIFLQEEILKNNINVFSLSNDKNN